MRSKYIFPLLLFLFYSCSNIPVEQADSNNDHSTKQEITTSDMNTEELAHFTEGKIIFYNVENLFDVHNDPSNPGDDDFTKDGFKQWDEERYRRKLEHIAEAVFIEDSAPLICGFAEVENKAVLQDLISTKRFKNIPYQIAHFDSEDNRGIDCGFIYDSRYFTEEFNKPLKVELSDDPDFRTRDILYVRGKLGEDELHLFVNHWSSRREGKEETEERRIAAAKTLRGEIDEILRNDPLANIITMGDFNDETTDRSIHEILRAKGQHELKKGDLVNLLIEEDKNGEGTLVHKREWYLFDQMMVSQGLFHAQNILLIQQMNAFVNRQEALLYRFENGDSKPNSTYGGRQYYGGYSDHLPIYLTLQKKKK